MDKLYNIFKTSPSKAELDAFKRTEQIRLQTLKKEYTIIWIRHAESCSNYARGNLPDKATISENKKKYLGYGKDFIKDPSVSNPYMKDIMRQNMSNLIEPSSRGFGQIFTDILSSTKSLVYEPNLSFIGMSQAINLSPYISTISSEADMYISSPMTRTIMTALLSLRHKNLIKPITIYICPFINEIALFDLYDYQNKAVPSNILKKRITFIQDWLDRNWISSYDDIEVMDDLISIYDKVDSTHRASLDKIFNCRKNKRANICEKDDLEKFIREFIRTPIIDGTNNETKIFIEKYRIIMKDFSKFKRGPKISYEIYTHYENLYKGTNLTLISSHTKFFSEVIPHIQKLYNDPKFYVIYAHGLIIKSIWSTLNADSYKFYEKELQHMMNTQAFKHESYRDESYRDESYRDESKKYDYFNLNNTPTKIRDSYFNFEEYNQNVCRKQSVKGVINYKFAEAETNLSETNSSDTKPYPIEQMDVDVRFAYDKDYKVEGFKHKYLKYKYKYLIFKEKNLNINI